METLRLGPTLLIVALAAVALAPPSGRTEVLRLVAGHGPVSYETLVTASTPDMTRQVAMLVAETFDVPLPSHVILHLYPTQMAFAHGLVRELGMAPGLALELASSAVGVARPRTVVLLADGIEEDRVRLVAHEIMHLVQHELAGPAVRPPQWMMEGTAEWAALTLLDRLGAHGAGTRIAAARTAAGLYFARDPAFSPARVRRSADFRRWQHAVGGLLAYQVVYALADQLVARHGVPAVVAYFRAFRDHDDPAVNFRRAFGTSPEVFSSAARAGLGAPAVAPPSCPSL